jgi:GT2 family glycosyltransferase
MDVSIIIVNYNTSKILCDCLQSIFLYTVDLEYEIIVVDNASKDDSVIMVSQLFPKVKIIVSSENIGFGRANNLGVKYAIGKYLLLLNPDTILKNNAIRVFFNYMEQHSNESIGAIGGWLLDNNGKVNVSFGYFPSFQVELYYLRDKFLQKERVSNIKEELEVDFVMGADLFIRKSVFDDLKGFDPNFFMYYEETDLQFRMKNKALKRLIIPGTNIVHLEGGSFNEKAKNFSRFMISQKSRKYYMKKYFFGFSYLSYYLISLFNKFEIFRYNWTFKQKIIFYKFTIFGK